LRRPQWARSAEGVLPQCYQPRKKHSEIKSRTSDHHVAAQGKPRQGTVTKKSNPDVASARVWPQLGVPW
jgi:hypothetical protein